VLLCLVYGDAAHAQRSGQTLEPFDGVGMDEQLGSHIPTDLVFRNEAGQEVRIGSYLKGEKPVLLNFVYHNCPMLCSLVLDGLTQTLKKMEWTPGEQFEVLTVSFASTEGPDLAARSKERYLGELGRPAAASGWHFLTGTEENIQALARSVGFQFRWIEEQQEYAHPAALIFLSGGGKITRYVYGMDFPARDVRAALVEASEGKVGSPMDQVFLYCFRYDHEANSYVLHATNLMKAGGALTLLALGSVLFVFWRRERKDQKERQDLSGATPATAVRT
jgi:protein SCO1